MGLTRGCNQPVIFFNTFFESQDFSYLSASLIDRFRSMGKGRCQGCLLAYEYGGEKRSAYC